MEPGVANGNGDGNRHNGYGADEGAQNNPTHRIHISHVNAPEAKLTHNQLDAVVRFIHERHQAWFEEADEDAVNVPT